MESPTLPSPSLLRKTDFHPFSRVLQCSSCTRPTGYCDVARTRGGVAASGPRSLSLFGSVARGETETDSDIDLAAEFDPATRMDLLQLVALERRITALLGSPVDLLPEPVEKRRLQDQINRDRRRASKHDPAASFADILENLERIQGYVAGLDREAFGGDTLGGTQSSGAWNESARPPFVWGKRQLSWRRASLGAISVVWVTDCVTLTTVSTSISYGTPSETDCPA